MNALSSIDDPAAAGGVALPTLATVASTCAESGWPFQERAGECLVKLELRRQASPFYARLARAADGGIIVWVDLTAAARELGGGDEVTPACRRAVEALLAEMPARMRLVRGRVSESQAGWVAGFVARVPADGGGEELAEALSALSVACELAGPEIQLLLTDPDIAESYLTETSRARGRSPSRRDAPGTRVPGESRS